MKAHSKAMKAHTNEHTLRGRPTLKEAKQVGLTALSVEFTSEHSMNGFIKNHAIPLSTKCRKQTADQVQNADFAD